MRPYFLPFPLLTLRSKTEYDVIDIDPFGSCAPFVRSAFEV